MRVPKTGSTSTQAHLIVSKDAADEVVYTWIPFLNINSIHFPTDITSHLNLANIISYDKITEEALAEFKVYGIIRNPVDRFISRAYHQIYYKADGTSVNEDIPTIEKNNAVERSLSTIDFTKPDWKPQSHWLTYNGRLINSIFPYERLNDMVIEMTGTNLPYQHRTEVRLDKTYGDLDPTLIDRIKKIYADDVIIYEQYNNLKTPTV